MTGTMKAATRRYSLVPTMVLAVLSLGFAAGCTDKADVTLHEPGVYKGSSDPLLAKEKTAEHQEALEDRFLMGQSDR